MIVVDASVLVTALFDDAEAGERARERLKDDTDLHAPHLIDLEVAARLRRGVLHERLDQQRAAVTLEDLAAMDLKRYPHIPFMERIWELRENLTTYDAAYIALAEELDAPLVTADERLVRAPGPRCARELLV